MILYAADIKNPVHRHYEQHYANKLGNLDEMYKFIKKTY